MEKWYVMRTVPGKEARAAELMDAQWTGTSGNSGGS